VWKTFFPLAVVGNGLIYVDVGIFGMKPKKVRWKYIPLSRCSSYPALCWNLDIISLEKETLLTHCYKLTAFLVSMLILPQK
jgi:hypothetical protein